MFATLAGTYPWPADLAPGEALAAVVAAQVEAGLGLISDGLVHPADGPAGELAAAWVRARDVTAGVAPGMPVKLAVAGPFGARGVAHAVEVAQVLNAGLAALAAAGCPIVEVHEPAATLPGDDRGRSVFLAAHGALLAGTAGELHACLAITGGDALAVGAEALFGAPYRSHLFDLLDGPESWRLVAVAPGERGIVAGVGDATGRRRTRLEDVVWAASYAASTRGRGMDRVGIAPSGSLAALPPERARSVLELLGEAARTVAGGADEVLARLDPRAIDARSAALGQYQPRRRRPDA